MLGRELSLPSHLLNTTQIFGHNTSNVGGENNGDCVGHVTAGEDGGGSNGGFNGCSMSASLWYKNEAEGGPYSCA